jgi:signal transduction histidine kinase
LDARSAIFAPLVESGESMGVLAVLHREPNRFGQEELFILRHFADLASLALRNARYLAEVQERARVEGELEASRVREEMRSELLRRVIRAQEDERRRVSRDLHDSAGQALTSILLGLKVVEQEKTLPEARARVADLREIASEAAGELRRLALELRPTVLDDLGLEAAAERYLRDFRERSGTTVRARLELGERRLDPEVETVVYRVLQESLTNIAKYAEAKTVNVALTFDGRILKLRVRDDGRGFDPGTVTGGLGLRGMQERADLVHGKVDVTSVPGGGTSVELAIPDVTEAMS